MENKMGLIFHWGLYSVTGYDDIESLRRRRMKNGSEWYYRRLTEKSDYRPISGHKSTKEYHNKKYGNMSYYDLKEKFDEKTKDFSFDNIFKQLVNDNIHYVILTAKHHDGFCLWDTKTTKNKSERDLLKDFIEGAKKYNLMVGIYYSWFEFNRSITKVFMNEVLLPQMRELRLYNPDYWWFDGEWEIKTQIAKKTISKVVRVLRKSAIVNSRVSDDNYDIKVFGDRMYPNKTPKFNWEYIFTIGHSWGYNRCHENYDYKSGNEISKLYKIVKKMNGNFLINFGPKIDGTLDENELRSYNEFMETL